MARSPIDFTDKVFRITKSNIAIFWLIMIGLSGTGLLWLNTLAANTGNTALGAISTMFGLLLLLSISIETVVFVTFNHKFWGNRDNTFGAFGISMLWFFIGFGAWLLVVSNGLFSLLEPMALLSQANTAGVLTEFQNVYFNVFMAPIIEENFFRVALPILVMILLVSLAKTTFLSFLDNLPLQVGIAVVVSSFGFALFHTQQLANTQFQVQAFVFGAILSGILLFDLFLNFLPDVTVVPGLLVGVHMANNAAFIGLETVLSVLMSNFAGWAILALFGVGFIAGVSTLFDFVREGGV